MDAESNESKFDKEEDIYRTSNYFITESPFNYKDKHNNFIVMKVGWYLFNHVITALKTGQIGLTCLLNMRHWKDHNIPSKKFLSNAWYSNFNPRGNTGWTQIEGSSAK